LDSASVYNIAFLPNMGSRTAGIAQDDSEGLGMTGMVDFPAS
jgi:hypothetical protein